MSLENEELIQLKLKKLKLLEEEKKEREMFPHLHAHKFYSWSRDFFEDWNNRVQVLVAANQISKSSTLIKKLIDLAISPEKWKELWPELGVGLKPSQWWYLYPTKEISTIEYHEKWVPLLPKVPQDDPQYGWKADIRNKHIFAIRFNSGISIYFKTYAQDVQHLQGGSCHVMGLDEEVPVHLLPELQMRTSATDGFMFFVFTATLGQKFWKEVVEERSQWKHAKVRQISMIDCETYEDGSASIWTAQRIQSAIDKCTTKAEVQRRIYGRFVVDEGLRYPGFDRERHLKPYHRVPDDWTHYAGIDYGSGGENGHPSAISIVAVNQDKTKIRVVRHWRGDRIQTTAQDILNKYVEMCKGINVEIAWYDYAARDLKTIAERIGMSLMPAEKKVDIGEGMISSILKLHDAFCIYDHCDDARIDGLPEDWVQGYKIAEEMESLVFTIDKRNARDNSIDSLRYAIAKIALDWEALTPFNNVKATKKELSEQDIRKGLGDDNKTMDDLSVLEELEFWQEQIDN